MKLQLEILWDVVRKNQLNANLRTQKYYNQNSKVSEINVGDRVLLHDPNTKRPKLAHKCTPKWAGPYLVIDKQSDYYTYKLQDYKTKKVLRPCIYTNRRKIIYESRK